MDVLKKLVAFYSLTGNTRFVAEKIAEQLNADLCEVTDKNHKKGKTLFLKGGYASIRQKLTEIEVTKPINDYDLVIVGSPVWAGKIAPAIRTFLATNDFSDKQVAFFVTVGGNKTKKTFENIKKTIEAKTTVKGLAITKPLDNQKETQEQVVEWCRQLKNE